MAMDTQDALRPAGPGIDDVLVPLVGLTVLGATFGAPGLGLVPAAGSDGVGHGVDAALSA
jgi:hypothetical protein